MRHTNPFRTLSTPCLSRTRIQVHALMPRRKARTRQRTSIRPRDRDRLISLLARRSRDMIIHFRYRLEAILRHAWRSMLNANRWRLQRKRFGLREGGLTFLCILRCVVFSVFRFADRVVMQVGRKGGGHGCLLEARGVWCRLTAELGEVQV